VAHFKWEFNGDAGITFFRHYGCVFGSSTSNPAPMAAAFSSPSAETRMIGEPPAVARWWWISIAAESCTAS
jgi:hypothetical protein